MRTRAGKGGVALVLESEAPAAREREGGARVLLESRVEERAGAFARRTRRRKARGSREISAERWTRCSPKCQREGLHANHIANRTSFYHHRRLDFPSIPITITPSVKLTTVQLPTHGRAGRARPSLPSRDIRFHDPRRLRRFSSFTSRRAQHLGSASRLAPTAASTLA